NPQSLGNDPAFIRNLNWFLLTLEPRHTSGFALSGSRSAGGFQLYTLQTGCSLFTAKQQHDIKQTGCDGLAGQSYARWVHQCGGFHAELGSEPANGSFDIVMCEVLNISQTVTKQPQMSQHFFIFQKLINCGRIEFDFVDKKESRLFREILQNLCARSIE